MTLFMYDIQVCPRCDKEHKQLEFKEITKPILEEYTHWVLCPETKQPIIVKIKQKILNFQTPEK